MWNIVSTHCLRSIALERWLRCDKDPFPFTYTVLEHDPTRNSTVTRKEYHQLGWRRRDSESSDGDPVCYRCHIENGAISQDNLPHGLVCGIIDGYGQRDEVEARTLTVEATGTPMTGVVLDKTRWWLLVESTAVDGAVDWNYRAWTREGKVFARERPSCRSSGTGVATAPVTRRASRRNERDAVRSEDWVNEANRKYDKSMRTFQ